MALNHVLAHFYSVHSDSDKLDVYDFKKVEVMQRMNCYFLRMLLCVFLGLAAGINISLPLTSLITICSLAVLFSSIESCKKPLTQSFLIFLWAFGFVAASTFWMIIAIYDPVLTPLLTASLVAASLYIFHALIYAASYYIIYKLLLGIRFILKLFYKSELIKNKTLLILGFSLSLGFAEIIRAQGALAMPWGMIGYTQTSNPLFLGIYPIVGAYGVATVTAAFGAILALTFLSLKNELLNKPAINFLIYLKMKSKYTFFITIFAMLLFSTQYIDWTLANDKTLRVRVIHTHMPNIQKYDANEQVRSLQKIISLSSMNDVDLTVYSELYLVKPAHGIDKQSRRQIVDSVIASKNTQFFGTPDYEVNASGRTLGSLNVMLQIDELGQTKHYAKEILLPFSEYMPTHPLLLWAMPYIFKFPLANFKSGIHNNTTPLQVKNINLAISLCNEIAYANNIHKHASQAQVLINSASDSWIPNKLYAIHSWQINRVRAIEAQKPMIRSNNTGYSGYIDPWGKERAMEYEVESTEKYEITPRFGNTPYTNLISFLSKI
jgi:apolipoprotein N-acyltransferase